MQNENVPIETLYFFGDKYDTAITGSSLIKKTYLNIQRKKINL